jgi:methyl-accepting chemotaxis protein
VGGEVRRRAPSAGRAGAHVKTVLVKRGAEVQAGERRVAEAVGKLGAILEAARSSSQLMEAIARESSEQASAIEQVGASVRTLDEMTQHNAALVEQTNAAIEQTEAQAAELDGIVAGFRIDGEIHSTGRRHAA